MILPERTQPHRSGPRRALEFPGLGGSCMGGVDAVGERTSYYVLRCAHENILPAYIFTAPWSWMNDQAVLIADTVLDATLKASGSAD